MSSRTRPVGNGARGTFVTDLPDCSWCAAANTLTVIAGIDVPIYECSCCAKLTRVDETNRAHRVVPRQVIED